jgi:hypothetical protein
LSLTEGFALPKTDAETSVELQPRPRREPSTLGASFGREGPTRFAVGVGFKGMTQQLLEELEALREAHRTARSQADFDALGARMRTIEGLSAAAPERSRSEKEALAQVKTAVSEATRAHREGLNQPTNVSGAVFALMQAIRRGTTAQEH